jgi:uncharacterized membrane protein
MAEETKNKLVEIGRWIAVIPFGLLCGILVLFPLHWILYCTLVKGSMIEMPLKDMAPIERFLSPIVSSIFFVYAGAMIAPKKQFMVSIVLFIISLFIRIGLLVYINNSPNMELDMSFWGLSRLFLAAAAGALGILFVYFKLKSKTTE